MSFKDKILNKRSSPKTSTPGVSPAGEGPREYFPKQLGIYCIDNPAVERRDKKPLVIGLPPTHRPGNITFKDTAFSNTQHWLGTLFAEPILINIGWYPVEALIPGTDERIFPHAKTAFNKSLPILTEETGIEVPLSYELEITVENELARCVEELKTKAKTDNAIKYLTARIKELEPKEPTLKIRTVHDVKVTPRIFIPVLTTVVTEEFTDEGETLKTFEPVIAIFDEQLGAKKLAALQKNGLIQDKNDIGEAVEYLYGDLGAETIGAPLQLFQNKLGENIIAAKKYEGVIPKPLTPYLSLDATKFNISEETLLRIVVLEMIQLYAMKDDTKSIEGKLKQFFWNSIKKEQT